MITLNKIAIKISLVINAVLHPLRAYSHIKRLQRVKRNSLHTSKLNHYYGMMLDKDKIWQSMGFDLEHINSLKEEIEQKEIKAKIQKNIARRPLPDTLIPFYLNSSVPDEEGEILYILVRSIKPDRVLETGIAYGVSSCYILEAMLENGKGTLYSIDLPPVLHKKEALQFIGITVQGELRERWRLYFGESLKVMRRLLKNLKSIDMFLHDSEHTYDYMISEFTLAWQYLRRGGIFLSDDVDWNDAFLDFSDKVGERPLIINIGDKPRLGILSRRLKTKHHEQRRRLVVQKP